MKKNCHTTATASLSAIWSGERTAKYAKLAHMYISVTVGTLMKIARGRFL
jgi:hypothetical protein